MKNRITDKETLIWVGTEARNDVLCVKRKPLNKQKTWRDILQKLNILQKTDEKLNITNH